jgi:hypothetical protein
MPKLRSKFKKKSFFRPVHLQAILFLVVYNILSKTFLVKFVLNKNYFINFIGPYIFGVLAGSVFLYLLKHEDFFHFIKEIERVEGKKEKRLVRRFLHHGKILATLMIATLGGPIFAALTIRLLLPKYKYQFLLLAVGNLFSTLLSVVFAKSIVLSLTR